MADTRELILARLAMACEGVTGIVSVVRNQSDVPLPSRPGIIIHDGADTRAEDISRQRHRFAVVQRMHLTPAVELRLRTDTGTEAGTLISLFRGRIINAVCGDATLQTLVGTNGDIWLESFVVPEPAPDGKEARAQFEFVFAYVLKRGDLAV